jgi:hypothetical protein
MTNLLPTLEQKKVWAGYRARFALALALVLFALALIAALALVPSYLALEIAAPPAPAAGASTTTPAQTTLDVSRAQTLLHILGPIGAATSSPTGAIAAAINDRPKGISITHLVFTAPSQIDLVGNGTREAVSAYQTALQSDTRFAAVTVPVSSLVGSIDGHFTLTLTLK